MFHSLSFSVKYKQFPANLSKQTAVTKPNLMLLAPFFLFFFQCSSESCSRCSWTCILRDYCVCVHNREAAYVSACMCAQHLTIMSLGNLLHCSNSCILSHTPGLKGLVASMGAEASTSAWQPAAKPSISTA